MFKNFPLFLYPWTKYPTSGSLLWTLPERLGQLCCHSNLFCPGVPGGGGLVTKSCPILASPWTVACQAPLSMEFSMQEYWSGLPFPIPGDLPNPGIEPTSLVSPALAGRFSTTVLPRKPHLFPTCWWSLGFLYWRTLSHQCFYLPGFSRRAQC